MVENIEIKKKFYKQLDERQKRLFLGMEAQNLDITGVRLVSEGFGVHPHTVRREKKN